MHILIACLLLALTLQPAVGAAEISVRDDSGRLVTLPARAQRIVSLAPHVTELLYAAGAGDRLVAVGSYSDHPPAALRLPRIGNHDVIDYERLLALQPDLVIVWQSGNGARTVRRLQALGLPVFVSEPRRLEDIPRTLERFGRLSGTEESAATAAAAFRARLERLAARHAGRPRLRVFYQIWHAPLMTVGGRQMISQIIELCGGENVFAGLASLAPQVNLEAVLVADPEVIVASEQGPQPPAWLYDWRRWPQLAAVRENNLYFVPADLIQRQGPRVLDGAQLLCEQLEEARQKRQRQVRGDRRRTGG